MEQSDLIAQVQIDEQAAICPYCEQPLDGEPGVRYGHETLHTRCHDALGQDLDLGQPADAQAEFARQCEAEQTPEWFAI